MHYEKTTLKVVNGKGETNNMNGYIFKYYGFKFFTCKHMETYGGMVDKSSTYYWVAYELTTKAWVASGGTREQAVQNTKEYIQNIGIERLTKAIKEFHE